ncbi:hypothetical protein [Prolixibacter sp. NT017]|uniref:hypothetical protein n=1 Tax=Prolixibacter sp. NT017 TaxID=2652390 RepID=UPI0012990827|nr:hypothetical protein [Prolixibacter sp. NT017]
MERMIFRKQFNAPANEGETTKHTTIFSFAFLTFILTQESLEVNWSFFFLPV